MVSNEFPNPLLEEISQAGFEVIEHTKPWRFVRGTAKKNGATYFFKISPDDPELAQRLQKQASFDQIIGQEIDKASVKPPFRVPQVVQTRFTDTSNWMISEHFAGDLLATWTPAREPKSLENWLDKITDALVFLDSLISNNIQLVNDPPSTKTFNERMVTFMQKWSEEPLKQKLITVEELVNLTQIMADAPILPEQLQHGDFVPWHMIDLGNSFGLIDSEAASTHKARFYDVAYFYHRIFTKLWQPKLARKFLKTFLDKTPSGEADFQKYFLPLLAPRAIGGLFDYANPAHESDNLGKTGRSLHKEFLQLTLKGNLEELI